jgi:ABC-2 type transport system permease protein
MEYRVSFLTQAIMMMINNAIYFVFWVLFFDRFKQVGNWSMNDMFLLFGIVTTGFGLAFALFGNGPRLASLIEQGQMDYYLSLPRNALLHALASRSSLSAVGDIVFGILMFCLAGHFTGVSILAWIVCTLMVCAIMVAYVSLVGSMAFWLGRASILSDQTVNALLTFSMYPSKIFDGVVRFLLFTVIPAGFVAELPVEIVKDLNGWKLVWLTCFTLVILLGSISFFHRGLKRYESGNLMNVNL